MQNDLLEGIFPVLVVPFKKNGDIDFDSFKKLINFVYEKRVDGIMLFGLGSEFYKISDSESNKLIEVGKFSIPNQLFYNMVELFQQVLILALKLSMPIMAVEIILESGIGILMKAIPQIQVFSVNIQLKIMIGLVMLLILVPTFATFIENVIVLMFDNIESSLSALIT